MSLDSPRFHRFSAAGLAALVSSMLPVPVVAGAQKMSVSAGNFILSGTADPPGAAYTIVSSTDPSFPPVASRREFAGFFDASGSFSNAFPLRASDASRFYLLSFATEGYSINHDADLQFHFRADRTQGTNGLRAPFWVAAWGELTGLVATNAVSKASTYWPLWLTNGINGRPAYYFDSGAAFLTNLSLFAKVEQPWTLGVVYQITKMQGNQCPLGADLYHGGAESDFVAYDTASNGVVPYIDGDGGSIPGGGPLPTTNATFMLICANGRHSQWSMNGGPVRDYTMPDATATNGFDSIAFGCEFDNPSTLNHAYLGMIGDVMLWKGNKTTNLPAIWQDVVAYWGTKFP